MKEKERTEDTVQHRVILVVEDEEGLCTLPVSGPRMFRRIGLCYPAHQTLNPALRELIPELAGYGAS